MLYNDEGYETKINSKTVCFIKSSFDRSSTALYAVYSLLLNFQYIVLNHCFFIFLKINTLFLENKNVFVSFTFHVFNRYHLIFNQILKNEI